MSEDLTKNPNPMGRQKSKPLLGETTLAQVRIVSGLIIFAYITVHFSVHGLGLISREVMNAAGRIVHITVDFWPISIVLYAAIAVHILAALWKIFQRKTLKMPLREWAQLAFGLLLPLFILTHVMGTRYAHEVYGIRAFYDYVLLSTFVFSPTSAVMNSIGLVLAWLHGCIGLHMWMETTRWYGKNGRASMLIITVLMPVISLTGYLSAGRAIVPLANDGEFMGVYYERLRLSSDAIWGLLEADTERVRTAFIVLVAIVFLARFGRRLFSSKTDTVTIDYVDGPTLTQPVGPTLLEMSKLGKVSHASVCGGRGRCSTCRVRVLSGYDSLSSPDDNERKVLNRIRAQEDVRLACQLKPVNDLKIVRLLPSDGSATPMSDTEPWASGREKTVTVMFADLRDFTKTAESRLPFDVVYLINQFSSTMGEVVEANNGRIDKFLGDGFMALFGVEGSAEEGAKNALAASGEMIEQLDRLNEKLVGDLDNPLRMGIGVHTGSVILGSMGYGSARGLTAIGDSVNTASRLEAATKTEKCILCVSEETLKTANMQGDKVHQREISIRGKKQRMQILALDGTQSLAPHEVEIA